MKGNFVEIAAEGAKTVDEKSSILTGNRKLKNPLTKSRDLEERSIATNGGLEKQTNRGNRKLELAVTESSYKQKRIQAGRRNRNAKRGTDLILNP